MLLLSSMLQIKSLQAEEQLSPVVATEKLEKEKNQNQPLQLECEITAYNDHEQPTKTGAEVRVGICAVDPTFIPLGSILEVPGWGRVEALDTGEKVKGYIIDIWMPDQKKCIEWGRQKLNVKVIRWGREER